MALESPEPVCRFLCGNVMTGRGIDQILPHPGDPLLDEPEVHDAREYVRPAEARHGPVPRPASFDYIWGGASLDLQHADVRVVSLETSITASDAYWPDKVVLYRMHPRNIGCLMAGQIDCCRVAVVSLHWGRNWGHRIPRGQVEFARRLIEGGVGIACGHSAHRVKACEIDRDRLVLCGCRGFITDYEGICGDELFRPEAALAYVVQVGPRDGRLVEARLVPFQSRQLRLPRVSVPDAKWLCDLLNTQGALCGMHVELHDDGSRTVSWRVEDRFSDIGNRGTIHAGMDKLRPRARPCGRTARERRWVDGCGVLS